MANPECYCYDKYVGCMLGFLRRFLLFIISIMLNLLIRMNYIAANVHGVCSVLSMEFAEKMPMMFQDKACLQVLCEPCSFQSRSS